MVPRRSGEKKMQHDSSRRLFAEAQRVIPGRAGVRAALRRRPGTAGVGRNRTGV